MAQLDTAMLDSLDVPLPSYDRAQVTPSIVHFGVGGFHRAHEAVYLDEVLSAGELGWGICGVGMLPQDAMVRDSAHAQDGLYTLVTTAPDSLQEARVVGSIVRYIYAPDDPEAVLEILADPGTRIVSLTVTEGGYGINDATGLFDPHDELTLADLRSDGPPRSVLGYLTQGLRLRRERGLAPFTIVSCDNIQGNGHVARLALTSFARTAQPDMADWIAQHVAFPCSMVDRITPVTTEETRRAISQTYGIEDRWPVRSESFLQWVLEDDFPLGRPDLAAVGVQLVTDVEPYELMKLRLLNASHQAMSYLGLLAGHTWVHDVCRNPVYIAFLTHYMSSEAVPTLRPVPGVDLHAYCDQLLARFGNEAIKDTLERQVVDASERIPKFLLPVLREQLQRGGPIECCALVLAAWSLFLQSGLGEHGRVIHDQRHGALLEAVAREPQEPGAFLDSSAIFGDLGGNERLRSTYLALRAELTVRGPDAVLADWAAPSKP